jgi:ABC-2 type transport system ATP-binding protein
VVGENGAGKTTLLRLLPGLDAPTRGSVRVLGRDPILDPRFVRCRVGFMADDMPVFDVSVAKLLRTLSGYYPTWDAALVDRLVERFELNVRSRTRALSKGEGTRLRLILALAFRPQILVLDEPATGLDLRGRRELLKSILEIVQDPRASVIVSSHQLGDVERIADELLVLHQGRVLQAGPTDAIVGEHRTLEEALLAWTAA